jgi:hypothetical protein
MAGLMQGWLTAFSNLRDRSHAVNRPSGLGSRWPALRLHFGRGESLKLENAARLICGGL